MNEAHSNALKLHQIRNMIFDARIQLDKLGGSMGYKKEIVKDMSGLLTCFMMVSYDTISDLNKFSGQLKGGIQFMSRGTGVDWVPRCYVCGNEGIPFDNISAFVRSKEDGQKVVELFNGAARLDWRERQPNHIQVKVGTCHDHFPHLQKLDSLVTDGFICAADIEESKKL